MGQSLTDGQESRTSEEILPLTTRMDMECQTLLPTTKGNYPIQTAGATPDKDKNDDGTHTASTASTAWTAWTVDTGNATGGTHRVVVDGRFQPILLCEG